MPKDKYKQKHISVSPFVRFGNRAFKTFINYLTVIVNRFGKLFINPISAGVLENQDMLGGGQFDPPPLNPMFDVQI